MEQEKYQLDRDYAKSMQVDMSNRLDSALTLLMEPSLSKKKAAVYSIVSIIDSWSDTTTDISSKKITQTVSILLDTVSDTLSELRIAEGDYAMDGEMLNEGYTFPGETDETMQVKAEFCRFALCAINNCVTYTGKDKYRWRNDGLEFNLPASDSKMLTFAMGSYSQQSFIYENIFSPNARFVIFDMEAFAPFNLSFKKSTLTEAEFEGSELCGCTFEYAKLTFASFSDCSLDRSDFSGADLRSTSFKNIEDPLNSCSFQDALVSGKTTIDDKPATINMTEKGGIFEGAQWFEE